MEVEHDEKFIDDQVVVYECWSRTEGAYPVDIPSELILIQKLYFLSIKILSTGE